MKKLAVLFIFLFLLGTPVYGARLDPITVTDIDEDGDITFNDPGYTRDKTDGTNIEIKESLNQRGYIEFNITELWEINVVEVNYYFMWGNLIDDLLVYSMEVRPSTASDSTLYADCKNGTNYVTMTSGAIEVYDTENLGDTAVSDLQSAINANRSWFALGFVTGAGDHSRIRTSENGNGGSLIVKYYVSGDAEYVFSGYFYENGTSAGTIDVIASFEEKDSEEFTVNGSTTIHFSDYPELFVYEVDEYNRLIYGIGEDENLTILTPVGTAGLYDFTVYSYVEGCFPGYLEDYRYVNNSKTLVERKLLTVTNNEAPMVMDIGKSYLMQYIVDGTAYDFGSHVAGSSSTTFYITEISFSQRVQYGYKYIQVEGTRSTNNTLITVNYNDDLENTNSVTLEIKYVNGVVAYNSTQDDTDTIQFQWNGANNETEYIAYVTIDHEDLGNLQHVMPIGLVANFSRPFNLDFLGTGPTGFPVSDLLSMGIIFVVAGVGSTVNVVLAGFLTVVTAASLYTLGWVNWNTDLLFLGFAIVVIVGINKAKGGF